MKRTVRLNRLLPLLLLAVLLAAVAPRSRKLGYDYRIGGTWDYETLYAPFDFPVLKTTEQIQEEQERAAKVFVPYFNYSESVTRSSLAALSGIELGPLKAPVNRGLRSILERGVVADDALPDASEVIYVHKAKRAVKMPSNEVLGISEARALLLTELRAAADSINLDSLLRVRGVYSLVVPNLLYDAQMSEALNSESARVVSPTGGFVSAGELIVSKGDIVTAETAQVLDSYKKEYETSLGISGPVYWQVLGNFLVALMLVGLLAMAILFSSRLFFEDSRYYYLLFVFALVSLAIILLARFSPRMLYIAPLTLGALYLQAFVRERVIVPVYIISLLPLLVYADNGAPLFVIFLCGGMASIFGSRYLVHGWKQFLLALVNFAAMALAYGAFRLAGIMNGLFWQDMLRFFIASVLAVAGYPLIYLFEIMFNLVSNSRLADLADTSSSLLRELEQKAPGTFQHSLQVMNMAEAAARAVDANPVLLRTGALYHDIGKMMNPLCFVENESMLNRPQSEKYHGGLSPMQSAEDIIRHVSDGVELARRHRLPDIVTDFIRTHHGTTVTGYFWSKHLQEGGSEADIASFTYPGPAPFTKEQIILMLCDSVEAASRTLTEYTPEAFSVFVDKIVQGKADQGQFDNADITMHELSEVKDAIKAYLSQMHHGRVAYPQQKRKLLNLK